MRNGPFLVAVCGGLVLASVSGPGTGGAAPGGRPAAGPAAVPVAGRAVARRPVTVDLADRHAAARVPPKAPTAPLGRDGGPVSLPVRPGRGAKVPPRTRTAGGPNEAGPATPSVDTRPSGPPVTGARPTTVHAGFDGVSRAGADCGGCPVPDVNAAVGTDQIAETVDLRLSVYGKAGRSLCATDLGVLFGTTARLAAPRVQYDPVAHRYTASVGVVPTSPAARSEYLLAASVGDDACGRWRVYTVTFTGPLFPAGTRVDAPYLGQDRTAVLGSSNNFRGGYLGSAAWSVPKAALYAGQGFAVTAFAVAFSTAPTTLAGDGSGPADTYFLASVPGRGYQLYRMTDSAGPDTSLVLQATVDAPFTAPGRQVNQPGTAATLDPGDGRIPADPVRDGDFVWFTHGIDVSGFPGIRYGAISVTTFAPFVATVYRSTTSDDFNPSIGVASAGDNLDRIWLNWAYTDPGRGVSVTATSSGVGPGEGVPNLVGGLDLVSGSAGTSPRFGAYSSVEVDPTGTAACPPGQVAVVAQEYFGAGGVWRTRIARLGFC